MSATIQSKQPVWRKLFPPRSVGCLALNVAIVVGSFLLGLILVYGISGLHLSNHRFFRMLGAVALILSLGVAIAYGVLFYYRSAISAAGFAIGLLLLAVMLYFMAISSATATCHVSIAKSLSLFFGIIGSALLCYGVLRFLETKEEIAAGGTDVETVKALILTLTSFFSLLVIVTEFVLGCGFS